MSNRYVVTATPDQRRWGILDRELYGYCTLPDSPGPHPNLLPLEWRSRHSADAWLHTCYRLWAAGTVPAPDHWRPLRDRPSPWA